MAYEMRISDWSSDVCSSDLNRIGARARPLALVASFLIVALVSGWWLTQQPTGYATAIGEQKVATLEDGTRIALNTDTHLSVRYEEAARKIGMDEGEEIGRAHV